MRTPTALVRATYPVTIEFDGTPLVVNLVTWFTAPTNAAAIRQCTKPGATFETLTDPDHPVHVGHRAINESRTVLRR